MKRGLYIFFLIGIAFQGFAQTIDSLLEKANFELYEHPESAIKIGTNVLNAGNATQENKIDALLLISTAYSSERNYAKSLDYSVRAEQLLPKVDSDAFKIITYSRLGVQYQQLKIYNKAHFYLDKAIAVANNTKQKFDSHKLLGFNYAIRGMVYKEQMSCDVALNYFNKSLYHHKNSKKELLNYANMSVIVYNKGNCFLSLNEIDSARICYATAYDYAGKINANSLKAFANKGLAEVCTFEGKYDAAIRLLLGAEKMSADVGDQVLNQGIYKGLSDNYLLTYAMRQHELYDRKYEETTKRIKENNTKTLNQFVLQINADGDKEISNIESNALHCQIPLLAVVFLLLIVLLFDIYRARKKYKYLKLQREKLENIPAAKNN